MNAPAAVLVGVRDRAPALERAGAGRVELANVCGRTAVVRRFAGSPLKLLTPRSAGGCAHVVASTYGGGLLAGDQISLTVRAGDGTRCVLGTQASTKVYRSDGRTSAQSLDAEVSGRAVLAVVPDPVTCFAGARYRQRQRFRLAARASLLLVDWFTSGRVARGERWAFERYEARTWVDLDGRPVTRDALVLDASDGPVDAPHRAGRFDCLASVFVLGPAFDHAAAEVLQRVAGTPVQRRADLVAIASPVDGGALLRAAGGSAEPVGRLLTELLAPAWDALGDEPWSRKW